MTVFIVTATTWGAEETQRFGARVVPLSACADGVLQPVLGPLVELPDETIAFLKEVEPFGRFSVDFQDSAPYPHLHFYNEYD